MFLDVFAHVPVRNLDFDASAFEYRWVANPRKLEKLRRCHASGRENNLSRGCDRMAFATMVETHAGSSPLLATLLKDDLSHGSVCQDTQVRAMCIGQVVRRRGIRACGSSRVDGYYVRPHSDVRSG